MVPNHHPVSLKDSTLKNLLFRVHLTMSAFPLGRGVVVLIPRMREKMTGIISLVCIEMWFFIGFFCCGMEKLTFFMSERSCQMCPQGL